MATFHVNELLCFVSTQYDKLDRENLTSVILEFYARNELIDAKNTLVSVCDKVGISNLITEFRTKRIASNVEQKVAKDILDLWSVIDSEKGGDAEIEFVAKNPNRLPSVNADKFNLQFLISSILKLQQQTQLLQRQSDQQHVWLENIFKSS